MSLLGADLNIREIELFVIAAQAKSLREVARKSGLQPPHVSKIMKKFEDKLGRTLFRRTTAGVVLTADGLSALKTATKILEAARGFSSEDRPTARPEKIWAIGAISFLTSYLVAPHVGAWSRGLRDARFRLIEFTHNQLVPLGLQGAFDLAVHIGRLEWTHTWETLSVGKLQWRLYGRFDHALGAKCEHHDLINQRFVVPVDWHEHGYMDGDDHCPYTVVQRMRGDEASTAETALELVAGSNQLTFVPEILARNWSDPKRVRPIEVTDWPVVEKDIFLTVKADRVPQKIVRMLLDTWQK